MSKNFSFTTIIKHYFDHEFIILKLTEGFFPSKVTTVAG